MARAKQGICLPCEAFYSHVAVSHVAVSHIAVSHVVVVVVGWLSPHVTLTVCDAL